MIERPLGDPEIALEILRLRVAELEEAIRRLAEQDATLSVCDGNVTVEMDASLTDAERGAVERAADWLVTLAATRKEIQVAGYLVDDAATLRGLLARCAIGHQ